MPATHPGKIRILATSRPEGPIPDGAYQIPIPHSPTPSPAGQVAGVGPRLPYPLFEHAVGHLGGNATRAALYPILSQR